MRFCWILSTRRTGSTYLTKILNGLQIFPTQWREYYLPWTFNEYYLNELPKYNKIHYCQYSKYLFKTNIEEKLPGIGYVFLTRKNVYAQAVSLYFASKTNLWNTQDHDFNAENYKQIEIPFDGRELSGILSGIKRENLGWFEFLKGKQYIELCYEELVANPIEATNSILKFVESDRRINMLPDDVPEKMLHPLKKCYAKELRKLFLL